MNTLYEQDFYRWGNEQLIALGTRTLESLDIDNIFKEFESVVRREKNELKSKLVVLIAHLLKWEYQADLRSSSWKSTIRYCRLDISLLLEDSPSLIHELSSFWEKAYARAKKEAQEETGLIKEFPDECPFTKEQVLNEEWLPN